MAHNSLYVLGGFGLILYFSTKGVEKIETIKYELTKIEPIYHEWEKQHPESEITQLMHTFVQKTADLRNTDPLSVKNMTKIELLQLFTNLTNGPAENLKLLACSAFVSDIYDRSLINRFVEIGSNTLTVMKELFEDVFSQLPGESRETAKILTADFANKLQSITIFSQI